VQTEQPLSSVAAFALALVEASSRLPGTLGAAGAGEAGTPTVASDDVPAAD
jgi:hypothetical protein